MRYNPLSDTIEIYINSEWKTWLDANFTSLVLLDKSDVKSEITGGWSTSGYTFYGSTNTQTFAIGSNGITLTTSGGRIGIATNNAIDITNYSKLVVKGNFTSITGSGMGIHLSTTKSFNASTNKHSILASDTEITIDISDLTGLYYIGFGQNDNYTVGTVYSIKLQI